MNHQHCYRFGWQSRTGLSIPGGSEKRLLVLLFRDAFCLLQTTILLCFFNNKTKRVLNRFWSRLPTITTPQSRTPRTGEFSGNRLVCRQRCIHCLLGGGVPICFRIVIILFVVPHAYLLLFAALNTFSA